MMRFFYALRAKHAEKYSVWFTMTSLSYRVWQLIPSTFALERLAILLSTPEISFIYWLRNRLCWLMFLVVFLGPSREMCGLYFSRPRPLPSTFSLTHYSWIILSFDALWSELMTASWNKLHTHTHTHTHKTIANNVDLCDWPTRATHW
jgi:hypothetical protein